MNRALRRAQMKRCSFRKSGGGFAVTDALVPINSANDFDFSVKVPVNQSYSDCDFPARPGQLINEPNPALAQAAMAGGRRRRTGRKQRGGCGCGLQRTRRQRGGVWGFAIDPSVNVGGNGPNADAARIPVPCDARAGVHNMPVVQRAGAYSTGNAYAAECYKSPGSSLPEYNASTAGFSFAPSSSFALPDGVTAFNEVVPQAARVGGGKRRHSYKKRTHKNRKNRRNNRA